jgi:hypothetical protein
LRVWFHTGKVTVRLLSASVGADPGGGNRLHSRWPWLVVYWRARFGESGALQTKQ